MFDVITIGGATQDIFFISKNYPVVDDTLTLPWGEKFLADTLYTDIGGGAANASVGLARLGFRVAFWGKVGLDIPGQIITQRLKQEKVFIPFLVVDDKCQTSTSAILVGEKGERSIIMYRGNNDNLLTNTKSISEVKNTNWIYLSDLGENTKDLCDKILKIVKENNIKLCFVPGQHQLKLGINSLKALISNSNILILNIYEAYMLLKGSYPGQDKKSCHLNSRDTKEMLREFAIIGAKTIVITRDKCGVSCFSNGNFYESGAPIIKDVVDTTGAGDAFSSAFLAGVIKNKDIATCLLWGNKNAGAVISQFGAQTGLLPTFDQPAMPPAQAQARKELIR
jgi:sugar/nucleoside kinase (ribokinase family)